MSTGFMAASGSTPAAAACSAWARPISAPLAVTAELLAMFWALKGATRTPGPGQPSADAGRHDALAGVRRRAAHEQRAPHRADTLPAPIGLPPARVQPAHLDPAAARRHRAPPPRAARVEEQPAAIAGPGQRRTRARRAGSASSAMASTATAKRTARGSAAGHTRRQAPSSAGASRAAAAASAWSRASASRSATSRPATLARAPRRRGKGRAAARGAASSSASSRTRAVRSTTPRRWPQRARSRRDEQRVGARRERLAGGRPVDAVGEVQAQGTAPELDRLGRDTGFVCLTGMSRQLVR